MPTNNQRQTDFHSFVCMIASIPGDYWWPSRNLTPPI
jgi:hypothetical protein